MSRNYSASQFEQTFIPKRLQMYQVPRDPQPGVVSIKQLTYLEISDLKSSSIPKHQCL
jgi:hypothetical protein